MPDYKHCNMCDNDLPHEDFNKWVNGQFGLKPYCRQCTRKRGELEHWGTTYEELVEEFGDSCNICGNSEKVTLRGKTHRLCIDHDHSHCKKGCGECIRGLLCRSCNYQLGVLENKPGWMESALEYLGKDDF
ncbi:endonuclease VII [Gordonia phage Zany]|uniref:Endonuclease VII n=1 Tax=Gordonia phage Zany TaxID=2910759 RepID=A0AA49BNY0_9CAUD|nr:endonuclease VII [Gordonia phage Zany]